MRIEAAHKAKLFRMRSDDVNAEPAAADLVVVQFNPTSLSYTAQNTLEKRSRDANAAQFVAQTTAKLEFDLIFDNTHDGGDVRRDTDKIKRFLDPGTTETQPAPPMVGFRWGSFTFKGFLESFRETIDFFSAEGVPLRSTVKVSLSSLSGRDAFLAQRFADPQADAMAGQGVTLATVPERGTSAVAPGGGGRALAAQNGFESMRNPGAGVAAFASAGVQLKAAAAFSAGASAGAGFGAGAGAGVGFGASAGAGFGASAGAGFSAGAGASFGGSAGATFTSSSGSFGFASASASRGVSASMGAFAGLGASRTPLVARVDAGLFTAPVATASASASANFAIGGQVIGTASAGLKADVGATARIKFD